MRYKARVEEVVDNIEGRINLIDRMIEGRIQHDPSLATRVMQELKDELQTLRDMLSLED